VGSGRAGGPADGHVLQRGTPGVAVDEPILQKRADHVGRGARNQGIHLIGQRAQKQGTATRVHGRVLEVLAPADAVPGQSLAQDVRAEVGGEVGGEVLGEIHDGLGELVGDAEEVLDGLRSLPAFEATALSTSSSFAPCC
jgi:hypothetical protein